VVRLVYARSVPTKKRTPAKPLADYDAKRDFNATPEPPAVVASGRGAKPSFCVQKHLASHLHYDFRLEHGGVLLSWAVPKGPSLDPTVKRMAVHVEDHPVDYGSFEGVIPEGYGAGIVLLWDRGTWSSDPLTPDVDAAMAKGELKFNVDGVKLKGSWVLVRTRQRSAGPEQWLLIKHRDQWSGDLDVTEAAPQSVKSFGDLSDVLRTHGEPPAWRTAPPVKGGDAGKLLAEVMAAARTPVPPRRSKSKPAAKPKPVAAHPPPKLSNQTKVLYPKTGFTKGGLVDYYVRIAPLMLPQLAGRAVTLKRFPDGVDGKSFFEKRCASHRPDWVPTVRVPTEHGEAIDYCLIEDVATLTWAANLAAIELHVPLALAADPDRATAMVFDLDPGEPATQADCVPIALRLRAVLDALKLRSVVKTSGGKGLHVLVPLDPTTVTFEDTKRFARAVALTLERDDPKRVIASMSRAARRGKVFIDWSQNDRNKTTACAFSVRARDEPTVSWPIPWSALEKGKLPPPVRAGDAIKPAAATAAKRLMQLMDRPQRLPDFAPPEGAG
jgi:bifunctional non-homologous end joining protein LigD